MDGPSPRKALKRSFGASDEIDAKKADESNIPIPKSDEDEDQNENGVNSSLDSTDSRSSQKIVSKPTFEKVYNTSHINVGYAVIFNQINIDGFSERKGSKKDADDLKDVLEGIGFQVKIFTDLTSMEIDQELKSLSQQDHSNSNCLLVTILTHGKKKGMIFSKDVEFHVNYLWKYFIGDNCKTLVGKPKLFFVQACRGECTDPGILFKPKPKDEKKFDAVDSRTQPEECYVIPTLADVLIMYSTCEGYVSFRNSDQGSWFIQALCDELRENQDEEIMVILTGVNRRVAYPKQSYIPKIPKLDALKQMPIIQSMLTKSFYIKKRQIDRK